MKLILTLFLAALLAFAQNPPGGGKPPLVSVDGSTYSPAPKIYIAPGTGVTNSLSCAAGVCTVTVNSSAGGVSSGTSLPATCTVGTPFVLTNATPNTAQLYTCTATNTWTQQTGGTHSGTYSLGTGYLSMTETAGGSGWTAKLLVKQDAGANTFSKAALSDVGVIGVAAASVSGGATGQIIVMGETTCVADGTVTIGNLIGVGTTTAGRCKDLGTTSSNLVSGHVQIIGRAQSSGSAGDDIIFEFYGPGLYGSADQASYISFPAANCQLGAAATGFVLPASNYPTATCITGSNVITGALSFANVGTASTQSVQGKIPLEGVVTSINVKGKWRTSATSGSVVWQVQAACVADAETNDPSFNTAQAITDAAKGTTLQSNDFSLTGLTLTGCSTGETLYFKFFRDADHASDDLAAAADLLHLTFVINR